MLFVKIILKQEGSKQLTTQKCHRCTCKCLSVMLLIPDCKSRRDCQILCADRCMLHAEPQLGPAAPAGVWHFSAEEAEQPQAEAHPAQGCGAGGETLRGWMPGSKILIPGAEEDKTSIVIGVFTWTETSSSPQTW